MTLVRGKRKHTSITTAEFQVRFKTVEAPVAVFRSGKRSCPCQLLAPCVAEEVNCSLHPTEKHKGVSSSRERGTD